MARVLLTMTFVKLKTCNNIIKFCQEFYPEVSTIPKIYLKIKRVCSCFDNGIFSQFFEGILVEIFDTFLVSNTLQFLCQDKYKIFSKMK